MPSAGTPTAAVGTTALPEQVTRDLENGGAALEVRVENGALCWQPHGMDYLVRARRVFDIELAALKAVRRQLDGSFVDAVQILVETLRQRGKIIVVGIGKSGNIGDSWPHGHGKWLGLRRPGFGFFRLGIHRLRCGRWIFIFLGERADHRRQDIRTIR